MRSIVIYWSRTGNTEKAAHAMLEGLTVGGADARLIEVREAGSIDYFDYDLVCMGFPVYQWLPPEPVDSFLRQKHRRYSEQGRVKVGAPRVAGKRALIFCTYSGPHTGLNEALPAGKYVGQFCEHLGFTVVGEWYTVGEFHGNEEASTKGRLGDIRGRPSNQDLRETRESRSSRAALGNREKDTTGRAGEW
jgi:hypothetical protein